MFLENQKDTFNFKTQKEEFEFYNRLIRYKILLCHLVLSQLNVGTYLVFKHLAFYQLVSGSFWYLFYQVKIQP